MCAIAGLVRRGGLAPGDVAAVERMTAAQAHRGPDGDGFYRDSRVVLGHCRLSIIDVSPAGNQPMSNEDRSVWITYNGEIYNHQDLRGELAGLGHVFRSRTDTEVIVHGYEQWGIEGLLDRLRGMFAFGVYDSRRGLVLGRDRLGIKPLYYYENKGAGLLLFASEVKALLASRYVPAEHDMPAVAGFLLAGSVPAPATIIKNVACLPPGHYLAFRDAGTVLRKYWDLNDVALGVPTDVTHVRALLEDSISRHLMSDVPLGVFLSGGVDSGALVALASRAMVSTAGVTPAAAFGAMTSAVHAFRAATSAANSVAQAFRPAAAHHQLRTLTIVFDEPQFSESAETREVARRFVTDHQEILITHADFVSEIPNILEAMDQPTNDGVNTYFVSRAARQAGLTVALSGLGGDEVFWGYRHYGWLEGRARWLMRCPSAARKALSRGAALWGRVGGRDKWKRLAFLERGASSRELYLLVRGFFAPRQVMDLLEIGPRDLDAVLQQQFDGLRPNASAKAGAHEFNHLEFKRYLHDQLLRDTDVFSMAHSIEVRVPLLDHLVVEHMAAVDSARKTPNGINKPLLVGAVDDPLLLQAGRMRKRGFSFPMDRWMKASGDELEEKAVSGKLLNTRAVRTIWKDFRTNRLHWSRAWALTVLGATVHSGGSRYV
jgi:asparagine synthase (glutamine-hydrolysing)